MLTAPGGRRRRSRGGSRGGSGGGDSVCFVEGGIQSKAFTPKGLLLYKYLSP